MITIIMHMPMHLSRLAPAAPPEQVMTEAAAAAGAIRLLSKDFYLRFLFSKAPKGNGIGATGSKNPPAYWNPCFLCSVWF